MLTDTTYTNSEGQTIVEKKCIVTNDSKMSCCKDKAMSKKECCEKKEEKK